MAAGVVVGRWQKAARLVQHCCELQPGTAEAAAALRDANQLLEQQPQQPIPPKATWKKLVQQHKVPLQLGTAFSTAAQRSKSSAATRTAVTALVALLRAAVESEIGSSSLLGCSIQQQLQQAGVLPQLTAVMTAAAADARDEAAALAAAAGAAAVDIERFTSWQEPPGTRSQQLLVVVCLHTCLLDLHGGPGAPDVAWLCDPCGHTSAGLQLSFAALQHVSSVLQHVLPAVQQSAPQHAAALVKEQRALEGFARGLSWTAVGALGSAVSEPQGRSSEEDKVTKLLLSPHVLPCLAVTLLVSASNIKGAALPAGSGRAGGGSSSGGGSSRARERDSRSRGNTQQQQSAAPAAAAAAAGVSSEGGSGAPTTCQQQLLQVLSLAPEVVTCAEHAGNMRPALLGLLTVLGACLHYQAAAVPFLEWLRDPRGTAREQQLQQRWALELQVWLLLPTVLLPCASTLLSARVQDASMQDAAIACVQQLLRVSRMATVICGHLKDYAVPASSTVSVVALVRQVLRALLLLANQLQPTTLLPAQATASEGAEGAPPASTHSARGNSSRSTGGTSSGGSSSTNTSSSSAAASLLAAIPGPDCAQTRAFCANELSALLSAVVTSGLARLPSSQAAGQPTPVGERWVEVAAACEAQLRTATAAVQGGVITVKQGGEDCADSARRLLLGDDPTLSSPAPLARHMGLCGPEAFARELGQYYSLLSTVLRLSCCQGKSGELCWGKEVAGTFCLAAGMAAVGLLSRSGVSGGSAAAAAAATGQPEASAAAQESALDYLPSLVIFGRCCLFWAQQLQQPAAPEAPELLRPTAGALQQEQRRQALLHAYGACGPTSVCIPSLRHGAVTGPDCSLERICAVVSEWVADPKSAAAHAQLAAAGCGPQQLQLQLDALLAAQQGTQQQQGVLTDASLAALVQQLQTTGAMLSSIAVPHFCNHAACANLSGPTEVGLVSGAAACVAGAVWRATVGGAASGWRGRSTSPCAGRCRRQWQKQRCRLVHDGSAELCWLSARRGRG